VIEDFGVFGVDHGNMIVGERRCSEGGVLGFGGKSTSGFNVAVEIPLHRTELVLLAQG